jgi:hypothetical protein
VPTTPADRMSAHVEYFPILAAFPDSSAGRHPRLHFRGLLGLHSCYGPPGCSTAQGGLCHEASIRPVILSSQTAPQLPDLSANIWWILPPLVIRAFSGHTSYRGISRRPRR